MFTVDQTIFIETAIRKYGEESIIGRKELLDLKQELSQPYPTWFIDRYKVGHGKYKIPGLEEKTIAEKPEQKQIETSIDMLKSVKEEDITIIAPEVDPNYVQFGFFSDLEKIIKSKEFFPVMITGNHGNGKTALVAQVCAKLNRPLIRVNVHKETDEVALIGGPTLINGNIVYKDGPILTAMRNGWIVNCLERNEQIKVGNLTDNKNVKLCDMDIGKEYPVISYNLETSEFENDIGIILEEKERDDLYLIEFEDGTTITMTSDHPVIVEGNYEKSISDGLSLEDLVISL